VLTAGLLVVAVLLTWPVPRLLPRLTALERVPGPALLLWQAVSLSAIFAAICLAPLAILQVVRDGRQIPAPAANIPLLVIGLLISGLIVARLLLQGHRIGRNLRATRREHAELVDLLGDPAAGHRVPGGTVTVLAHPTPTAYCIPGRRRRVVLTDSTIRALPADELAGVLAHERAHLRLRHDLVLEFFTVLHTAVPRAIRSDHGMRQVRLLIELLADRAACRTVGPVPVARALVQLAGGSHPDAMLGAGGPAQRRMELLADAGPHRALATTVVLAAVVVVALTGVIAWGALLGIG